MARNIGFENVKITNGFWAEKQALVRNVTAKAVYDRFEETGRVGAFNFDWKEGMEHKPHIFWDSDIAKWIEGVANLCREKREPELEALCDALIDKIEEHQEPDGYFNIYFTVVEPGKRFTIRGWHELYCAGHLLESAISYKEATGKDKFYNLMLKYVDLIDRVFRVEQSAEFTTPGHSEIELALMRLYYHSHDEKYLTLAKFFIDNRGKSEKDLARWGSHHGYAQDHLPIREQTTAEGHSVRLCYLYCGVADVAAATGDKELLAAARKVFDNIIHRRMYLTGGIGSTANGEQFEDDFLLPNELAYTETCAAFALALFAQRMQVFGTDAKYADIIERVIYNGFLSGMSLSGDSFFYENPLSVTLALRHRSNDGRMKTVYPIHERVRVFSCSCCPPNVLRFIPSIGGLIYTEFEDENKILVNQYMDSTATVGGVTLTQKTDYPRDGKVTLKIEGGARRVGLRLPSWCESFTLAVNGKKAKPASEGGYLWLDLGAGDEVVYDMAMAPRLVRADARVAADAGRVAVSLGPVIYCVERVGNDAIPADLPLRSLALAEGFRWSVADGGEFGLPTLDIAVNVPVTGDTLYSYLKPEYKSAVVNFIPYYGFANRGASDMTVFMEEKIR